MSTITIFHIFIWVPIVFTTNPSNKVPINELEKQFFNEATGKERWQWNWIRDLNEHAKDKLPKLCDILCKNSTMFKDTEGFHIVGARVYSDYRVQSFELKEKREIIADTLLCLVKLPSKESNNSDAETETEYEFVHFIDGLLWVLCDVNTQTKKKLLKIVGMVENVDYFGLEDLLFQGPSKDD